jgi:molybdenum cofactor cytidylyltransferase
MLVLPGDMPFVSPKTVRAVVNECIRANRSVVAAHGGRRSHPLALPGSLVSSLVSASPTGSLMDALTPLGIDSVQLEVDDAGVLRDVDVPADLA